MKVSYIKYIALLGSIFTEAQIGIGTDQPSISLEIMQSSNINTKSSEIDGIIIPTLTKRELSSKDITDYQISNSIGTLIYVNDASGTYDEQPSWIQVANIIETGYHYFGKNGKWNLLKGDTTPDVWSNNPTNHYTELNNTSSGNTRSTTSSVVINDNGYFGINQTNPTKRLDINANVNGELVNGEPKKEFIKLSNLKEINPNINSSTLVIDTDGNIYKNDVEHIVGEVMRIPISGFTKGTDNPGTFREDEGALRLDFDQNKVSPACTTICNKNFINTIKGVNNNHLLFNQSLGSNTGVPRRVTDRIILPAGVYKIKIKLNGYHTTPTFTTDNTTITGTVILKLAIDNIEYSVANFQDSTYGTDALTSYTYLDYMILNKESTVDFLMHAWGRDFTIEPQTTDSEDKTIAKSMVLIERLR